MTTVGEKRREGLLRRIWKSMVLRGPLIPRTDSERAFVTVHTLLLHLRPVRLPARTIRFTHTFGLGGSSLVLVTILAVTGILMMFVYQPVPGAAYDSVVTLETRVLFGGFVRSIHYWSANVLLIVVLLHMARVFFTGGWHGSRQFNWVVGAGLLALVLANAFTGYLLPWDQLSYWAVTISTGMLSYVPLVGPGLERIVRGGAEVGPETLTIFHTIHTLIVPASLLLAMAFHFWRVRKAGGVVVPPPGPGQDEEQDEKVLFVPNLLVREAALALILLALVVSLGAMTGAPLGERANIGMSPNPAKAPWYFMGLQEMLVHLHPAFAVVAFPLASVLAFVLLPYLAADDEPAGAWFLSERGRRTTILGGLIALVATPVAVLLSTVLAGGAQGARGPITGGLLPFALVTGGAFLFGTYLRKHRRTSRNETIQAVAALLMTMFAVLTATGVFFRGKGMALVWPWAR